MKPADRGAAARLPADFSKVLVVGKSSINRVVVSKIVERCGLKPISEPPETAEKALASQIPGAVIVDGGPDDKDCDRLLSGIDALRRASGKALPSVILLSTRNGTPDSLGLASVVDAVVAKPITPERLQPVIDRLVGRC
ncbi:response regulator [Mesorhizobium sp. WSM4884]|uniref:response regulator n=1 Tax=Mesorhizobium sp. WSM4884 TaxID=3038542 RepID=UPI00241601F5|nr:response regulator [Mesorhizobium sp. WSM4884]MDG4882603.1 response regulator [Mesorhizobium sp. WSM4884]